MLYSWVYYLHNHFSELEIIKYISFRAGIAALTAFLISIFIGGRIIRMLKKYKVSEDTTKTDSVRLRVLHSGK